MVNRTIAIPGDEGNYVLVLNVFHDLHCLVSGQCVILSMHLMHSI